MYHIGLNDAGGAKFAILPGDPARVELIAKQLDNPEFVCSKREYTTWKGTLCGQPVIVMSTGMGGPSAAIGIEELFGLGVDSFVRVGTCGGMAGNVLAGDIVIATGAIRMEGTTREYVPIEFPAVADIELTNALIESAKKLNANWHAGVVHSKDSFYGQHEPDRMPAGYLLKQQWQAWIKAGCLASEMESAALFIVSQVLGARAACVLSTVWNQEHGGDGGGAAIDHELAIKIAVDSIKSMLN